MIDDDPGENGQQYTTNSIDDRCDHKSFISCFDCVEFTKVSVDRSTRSCDAKMEIGYYFVLNKCIIIFNINSIEIV